MRQICLQRAVFTAFLVGCFFLVELGVAQAQFPGGGGGGFGGGAPSMPSSPSPYRGNSGRSPSPYRPSSPNRYNPGSSRPQPYRPTPGRPHNQPGSSYQNPSQRTHSPGPSFPTPWSTPRRAAPSHQPLPSTLQQRYSGVPHSHPSVKSPQINSPRFGSHTIGRVYGRVNVPTGGSWGNVRNSFNQGNVSQGQELLKAQLSGNPSLEKLMSAVSMMEQTNKIPGPTLTRYRNKAIEMANAQIRTGQPTTATPWIAVAKFSLEENNQAQFQKATKALLEKHPNSEFGPYFQGIEAMQSQDWKKAETSLQKAREMGMPEESINHLLKMAIDNQKWIWEFAFIAVIVLAVWLVGLACLYVVGKMLSALTLRAIRRRGARAASRGGLTRRFYRLVIGISGIYYYLSLPILVLASVLLPASIAYAMLMLPSVGFVLGAIVLVVGCGGLLTAVSGLRAAFVRWRPSGQERALSRSEAPEIWGISDEVAQRVETRPVDRIILVPGAELAVLERGSYLQRMRDRGERVLVIGMATLDGFPIDGLRSVLAHEYGHFSHRDTAGGGVALRVRAAMEQWGEAIMRRGAIHWWDVAVKFLVFYYRLFSRLTFGASRLQEICADQVAVQAYGVAAFRDGMNHAIASDIHFQQRVGAQIGGSLRGKPITTQFYQMVDSVDLEMTERCEQVLYDILSQPSTDDDTHPSPAERFKLAQQWSEIQQVQPNVERDNRFVGEMLSQRSKLLAEMNANIHGLLKLEAEEAASFEKAKLDYLTAVIAQHPVSEAFDERAAVHLDNGRYDDAIRDVQHSLKKRPNNPNAQLGEAIIHMEAGQNREALEFFQKLFHHVPGMKNFDNYLRVGICLLRGGNPEKAATAFGKALDCKPVSIAARLGRGEALLACKQVDMALEDFRQAVEEFPRCGEAHHALARALEQEGNRDAAGAAQALANRYAPRISRREASVG